MDGFEAPKRRTKRDKSYPPMKYNMDDFIVDTTTGDIRIPYIIRSKDEKIEANVFWVEGEYNQIRGLIFDTKSGDIVHTFEVSFLDKAHGKADPSERFVRAVKLALERGHYNAPASLFSPAVLVGLAFMGSSLIYAFTHGFKKVV